MALSVLITDTALRVICDRPARAGRKQTPRPPLGRTAGNFDFRFAADRRSLFRFLIKPSQIQKNLSPSIGLPPKSRWVILQY